MIDNLPVQTAQIYDYLSKGNFLCSNTSVKELRTLFSVVEDNFERLRDYFSHINFVLEQGNNYFYFSRKEPRDRKSTHLNSSHPSRSRMPSSA